MHALHQHEPRAGIVVKLRQAGGAVIRRRPRANHILVTIRRVVAEIVGVKSIGRRARLIHVLRRPVAALEIRLRAIVKPDAEFGLPQPRRRAVAGDIRRDGRPRRLERPVRLNGEIHVGLGKVVGVAHRQRASRCRGYERHGRQIRQRVGIRRNDCEKKQNARCEGSFLMTWLHLINLVMTITLDCQTVYRLREGNLETQSRLERHLFGTSNHQTVRRLRPDQFFCAAEQRD